MVGNFHKYVLSECERQWNEVQYKDGYGLWYEQADDTKATFYNSMYEHLKHKMSMGELTFDKEANG